VDAEIATILGIACRYGVDHPSSRPGIAVDRLMPGCFAAALASQPTALCRMHDHHVLYAATFTFPWWLELVDDATALAFRYIVPADDLESLMLWREIRAGGLPEASVGFRVVRAELREQGFGEAVRLIHEADLAEISVVTSGAVPGTATLALGTGAARLDVRAALRTGMLLTTAHLAEADVRVDRLMAAVDRLGRTPRRQETGWPTAGTHAEPDAAPTDGLGALMRHPPGLAAHVIFGGLSYSTGGRILKVA
jgi:HK97 family phage prohead protease